MKMRKEIAQKHHDVIMKFMNIDEEDISSTLKATIAQFIVGFAAKIKHKRHLHPVDLIDTQLAELRRCIIDLEKAKEFYTKGVSYQ